MEKIYRVGGYVKLAKLWEKHRDEAIIYHKDYYREKFADNSKFKLCDVYIDITGKKSIAQRPEMLRLIRDCMLGKIDCIATQSKAYLAANMQEFCYLIKCLFDMKGGIDIITEDPEYNIDTITNSDAQKAAIYKMANDYIAIKPEDYKKWLETVFVEINAITH